MRITRTALALSALLAVPLIGCAAGSTASSSLPPDRADTTGSQYGFYVEFSSYAFTGPTLAGGASVGAIEAGNDMSVNYVRDWSPFGMTAAPTAIAIEYTIDGGAVQSVSATNSFSDTDGRIGITSSITIPADATKQLQIWFKFTDAAGKDYFDSRLGANYISNILPASRALITFAAPQGNNWPAPTVTGDLAAGKSLRIAYDWKRIQALGIGTDQAYVEGYVNSYNDSGRLLDVSRAVVPSNNQSSVLYVAEGTSHIEVYFVAVNHSSVAYDSNLGQNYHFDVAQ